MKIPPRWVFEIWNTKHYSAGKTLHTLPADCAKLDRLIAQVEGMFPDAVRQFAYESYGGQVLESGAIPIIGLAWMLYVNPDNHEDAITDEKTKFAFAGFLEAGGAQIVRANDLLSLGREMIPDRYERELVGKARLLFRGLQG